MGKGAREGFNMLLKVNPVFLKNMFIQHRLAKWFLPTVPDGNVSTGGTLLD